MFILRSQSYCKSMASEIERVLESRVSMNVRL